MRLITDAYRHRELLWSLVARDLKGRYVGSAMGFFWNIINPLILLSVYTFIFSYVFRAKIPPGSGTESFPVYLFCGLLPWLAFSETLTRSAGVVLENSSLVSKVSFPTEILVLYVAISSFIHELIALVLFFVFIIATGTVPGPYALLLPAVFVCQLMLTIGLSFIFSTMNVYLRDVAHLLNAAMMVWFFATPIIFPLTMVPEFARDILSFNPLTQLVELYRALLLGNRMHTLAGTGYFVFLSVAAFILGAAFFGRHKKEFPDLI